MLLRLIVQTWLAEWTEITGHYSVSIISSQGRRSLFACAALILGEWRVVVAGGGRLRLWVCDCKWNRSINNAWLSAGGWFLHPDQYSTVLSLFEGVSVQSAILAFFCPFFPPPLFPIPQAQGMVLFPWMDAGYVGFHQALYILTCLDFQCYKNGD